MKNTRHGTTNYRRLMQFIGDMAPTPTADGITSDTPTGCTFP